MKVIHKQGTSPDDKQLQPASEVQRLTDICSVYKDDCYSFRERRHPQWTETYQFYRDQVTINRLTQRQAVNIPLMKYTIKTLLKDIDDPPMLYFYNKSNDAQKEVFYNEYWKYCSKEDKLVVKDLVDKKQVLLFGRSFKKLNIVNGRFSFEIIDPQDMLVDRYVDPTNLDTANFVSQEHIFRALSALENNPFYDKDAIAELKEYYATAQGLIKAEENKRSFEDKANRLQQLGDIYAANPKLGETVVELNENYVKMWDEEKQRQVIWMVVMAEGRVVLAKQPLHELIGKTTDDYWMDHYPFTTWGEDPERTDFWCDGVGDSIRMINKILNSWISQRVENRTLRNFGMQYYDATAKEGFVPQTFDPVAFGWYPVPGNPNEIIKRVDIPDLGESDNDIKLLLDIADKTSGATATSRGETQSQKVTLGEVQLALANAKDRIKGMAPLYTASWEEFGIKYNKFMEAAGEYIDAVTVWKRGKNTGRMYSAEIKNTDWRDTNGYDCEVVDLSQNSGEISDSLQKLTFASSLMPNNKALKNIIKQKSIEWAGLNSIQVKEVMDAEKELEKVQPAAPTITPGIGGTGNMGGGGNPAPVATA